MTDPETTTKEAQRTGYWDCDCGRECRNKEGPERLPDCRAEWVLTSPVVKKSLTTQTTAEPITQEQVRSIARKHAKDVMAVIADAQMKTWEKWPPADGPTDFITKAMVRAIEEAGVKYVF